MIVGVLTLEMTVPDARSLKDKRRVVKGMTERLRNRFNVSVAEVGFQNQPKRCTLGVAMVSQESRAIHSQMDKIVDVMRRTPGLSLLDYNRELF